MREITYCKAINEALIQEMERDPTVFIYGIGVPDHKKVFGSVENILEKFGPKRCFDTPISEDSMTGIGFGSAINGLRPIHVHIRMDFLLLATNQLANILSSFRYISAGEGKVPIVIRAIIGRGWGQGCQHSKSMYSIFAHVPGLKVVLPTTPYDVKGMLISSIRDDNPVIFIEHRWLYWQKGNVPEYLYTEPIKEPKILRAGNDITIVALSWMVVNACHAAKILEQHGVSVEIIDLRVLSPLNEDIIVNSVNKTRRCLIVDNDWLDFGASAEIAARISNRCFGNLIYQVERIGFKHCPCPTVRHLEDEFYPTTGTIIRKIEEMLRLKPIDLSNVEFYNHEKIFTGPF